MSRLNDIFNYKSDNLTESNILKNKLGLTDEKDLEEAERLITNYKLAELYMSEKTGNFDIDHYLSIHQYLFDEIYEFAGKIRDENIIKTIPFCLPNLIYSNLKETLIKAKKAAFRIRNEDELISFLANYYSEIDIIHPFREGNGRTEREFFREYILKINEIIDFGEYELDYSLIDNRDNFVKAIIMADATCDFTELKKYMKMILVNKWENRKTR